MAKLHKIGALFFAPEVTFGTDPDPAGGSDVYVQAWGALDRATIGRVTLENEGIRQKIARLSRIVAHTSETTLSTRIALGGWLSTTPVAAPAAGTRHPAVRLLAYVLGGLVSQGYDGTGTVAGSTTANVKATSAASFVAGQAIALDTSATATPQWEVGWLTNADTVPVPDELALLQLLRAAPQNGKPIYGSHCAYMISDYGTQPSITLRWKGHDATDQIILTGCRPRNVTIEFGDRGLPIATIEWVAANVSYTASGGAPAVQTWSYPEPQALIGARCTWGTDMATVIDLASLRFDLRMQVAAQLDPNATNGIGGWDVIDRQPMVTFRAFRSIANHITRHANQTALAFSYTWGTGPGRMVSLCLPEARVEAFPSAVDLDGRWASEITLYPTDYTGDTGTDDDTTPTDKDCRIAFA